MKKIEECLAEWLEVLEVLEAEDRALAQGELAPCDYCGELCCEGFLGHEGLHYGFDPEAGEEVSWE